MMNETLEINGTRIPPGTRATIDIPLTKLYTHTMLAMPVHVVHGKKPGPRLFVSAAIHGDELNGVEIIRRLLQLRQINRLHGTLFAIPIVNVHGFLDRSRYLPDRRDLNRSFPGSEHGSLASRVARLFMEQIVERCTHGIDLHTGALHRSNLPHIRAYLDDAETSRLAEAFGTAVMINSNLRDGSLRQAAVEMGVPMLLYEAGEALRFDEISISAGVKGVVNVMRSLDMLPHVRARKKEKTIRPVVARSSSWVRAPESGILRALMPLGVRVSKGDVLAIVADPFGEREVKVAAPYDGIIIGRSNLPLVHEGEALFHLARFQKIDDATAQLDEFNDYHRNDNAVYTDPPETHEEP